AAPTNPSSRRLPMPTTRYGPRMPGSGAFVAARPPLLVAAPLHPQAALAHQAGRPHCVGTKALAHLVDGEGGLVPERRSLVEGQLPGLLGRQVRRADTQETHAWRGIDLIEQFAGDGR